MNNLERIDEIVRNSIEFYGKSPIPSIIEVSPSDFCNLKCTFCPKSFPDDPNNPLFMKLEVVKRLASELDRIGFKGLLLLGGYGEPLIHPQIVEVIRILSEVCRVDLITNGTKLDERMLSKILLAGINKILVSSYTPEMTSTMEALMAELPYHRYEIRPRYTEEFRTYNRAGVLGGEGIDHPCYYTLYEMMIDWQGDVLLCCQDWVKKARFGNIMSTPIEQIWDSPSMNKYRFKLMESRKDLFPCKNCNIKGTLHGKEYVELWKQCKS